MVLILKKGATEEEMQAIRNKLHKKTAKKTGIDLNKYSGILKLKEDPLIIQKKMRDEWGSLDSLKQNIF